MATFPPLEPLRREWSFPDYPTLAFDSGSWGEIAFEYGDQPTETPLQLVYSLLSEAEMQLIRDHYQNQREVFPFILPAAIWAGYDTSEAISLLPIAAEWLYDGPIEEEPVAPGLYDCTVKLVSLPVPAPSTAGLTP